MPQIKEFQAPALGIRPTETGISATAAAARRVQGEFNEAAAAISGTGQRVASTVRDAGDVALKAAEHFEISRGAKALAETQDAFTKQWNEIAKNADPNDPTVGQKFMDQIEPQLDKLRDGFLTEGGQKWAESRIDRFREHLMHTTSADMSTKARSALSTNLEQTVNRLSSTVRNDPSSVNFAIEQADSTIGALVESSPNLKASDATHANEELRLKAKEQIVKSFLMGVAEKNPEEAQRLVESGKYANYIKGDEAKTIINYARANRRLADSETRSQRAMQEHQDRADFHKAANDLELATIPQNVGEPVTLPKDYWETVKKIAKMPGAALEPARVKSLVDNGERVTARMNKPEPMGPLSHETTMGLLQRMRSTDTSRLTSDDDIYKAYFDGKLNNADFNFLRTEYANMKSPAGDALNRERAEFFKRFEGFIDPDATLGVRTKEGQARFYAAEMAARRMEDEARKAGKNPHDVYDPDSPFFFGRPANMLKYGPQALQDSLQQRASGGTTQRFAPPPTWQWSPSRQQYRDPATGAIYDREGKAMSAAPKVPESR